MWAKYLLPAQSACTAKLTQSDAPDTLQAVATATAEAIATVSFLHSRLLHCAAVMSSEVF